jgi:hypothetical protein
MKIQDMVCCAWHEPRNAIVELTTGKRIPRRVLEGIPHSPEKEHMMYSGGMCDPCASGFSSWKPKPEGIIGGSE